MFLRNIIYRLLQYRSCLHFFKELGFSKIFSTNLAIEAGVSSEQVRKDFSLFDIKGNKKGGYIIEELLNSLDKILQKNIPEKMILIGMGNIGKALAQYKGFNNDNISIVAALDIDPSKHNKSNGLPIYPINKLEQIISKHNVKIAILTVPASVAQDVCNLLVKNNIKGIINFAPIVLKVPEGVLVNNINLSHELNNMIYLINMEPAIHKAVKKKNTI